jgi:hypothetical protein
VGRGGQGLDSQPPDLCILFSDESCTAAVLFGLPS